MRRTVVTDCGRCLVGSLPTSSPGPAVAVREGRPSCTPRGCRYIYAAASAQNPWTAQEHRSQGGRHSCSTFAGPRAAPSSAGPAPGEGLGLSRRAQLWSVPQRAPEPLSAVLNGPDPRPALGDCGGWRLPHRLGGGQSAPRRALNPPRALLRSMAPSWLLGGRHRGSHRARMQCGTTWKVTQDRSAPRVTPLTLGSWPTTQHAGPFRARTCPPTPYAASRTSGRQKAVPGSSLPTFR